ncbi:hypothetical protein DXG03_001961 [Asterophora parasitica]|uniref:Core domain-containing protein n=1 Tax=Asterophora parasitica TaxID=117018 RepID=A0A9P7GGF9_9AGAR|nr:hypothetical protein DXG03_001961 [Asterophora parasitica]
MATPTSTPTPATPGLIADAAAPQIAGGPPPAPKVEKARPKIRASKAALTISPGAVARLRALLTGPTPRLIRIGVKNKGCAGLAYNLEYVEKGGRFDEVVEQDGVQVLIDSKALFSIIGSRMDWTEDALSSKFTFENPNIKDASWSTFTEMLAPANPDNRPLPPGWNQHFDATRNTWYYVCTNVKPPHVTTEHPLGQQAIPRTSPAQSETTETREPPTPEYEPALSLQPVQPIQPKSSKLSFAQQLYASASNPTQAYKPPSIHAPIIPTPPMSPQAATPGYSPRIAPGDHSAPPNSTANMHDFNHNSARRPLSVHGYPAAHRAPHRAQTYGAVATPASAQSHSHHHRTSTISGGMMSRAKPTPNFTTTLRPPSEVSESLNTHTTAAFQAAASYPSPPPTSTRHSRSLPPTPLSPPSQFTQPSFPQSPPSHTASPPAVSPPTASPVSSPTFQHPPPAVQQSPPPFQQPPPPTLQPPPPAFQPPPHPPLPQAPPPPPAPRPLHIPPHMHHPPMPVQVQTVHLPPPPPPPPPPSKTSTATNFLKSQAGQALGKIAVGVAGGALSSAFGGSPSTGISSLGGLGASIGGALVNNLGANGDGSDLVSSVAGGLFSGFSPQDGNNIPGVDAINALQGALPGQGGFSGPDYGSIVSGLMHSLPHQQQQQPPQPQQQPQPQYQPQHQPLPQQHQQYQPHPTAPAPNSGGGGGGNAFHNAYSAQIQANQQAAQAQAQAQAQIQAQLQANQQAQAQAQAQIQVQIQQQTQQTQTLAEMIREQSQKQTAQFQQQLQLQIQQQNEQAQQAFAQSYLQTMDAINQQTANSFNQQNAYNQQTMNAFNQQFNQQLQPQDPTQTDNSFLTDFGQAMLSNFSGDPTGGNGDFGLSNLLALASS